jgi:pyruvate/2-oxoglutarate dehydrogenase complex dihydrolipoamide dehydrogenase (E3) component
VNGRLETSAPGIWALGDVKGGPAFTHISYNDFQIIFGNLVEGKNLSTDNRIVPYSVFTDPQLGGVGITEKEARSSYVAKDRAGRDRRPYEDCRGRFERPHPGSIHTSG